MQVNLQQPTYNQMRVPEGYTMVQSNVLDAEKKSQCITIENDERTAVLTADQTDAKTILGTVGMQRFSPNELPNSGVIQTRNSKYYILYHIEQIESSCLCVGIQQVGADLEKDSFNYRYGFQFNCKNGDVFRLGQQKAYCNLSDEKYTIESGSTVGIMLDMKEGEICFTVNGNNCGPASKDKRLKQGVYYSAILMMSKLDRVTLLNPRKVQNAALGYELMLSKFKIYPKNNEALFELLDQVQEYFTNELGTEKEQERHLHRLIMVSYLNDMNGFEKLGQLLRNAREKELAGTTPEQVPIQTDTGVTESIIYKQIEHTPENKDLEPSELLKILIQAQMNPRMIPFANFHDDSILSAFNYHVRQLDITLIKLSFLFENVCLEEREEPAETQGEQLDTGSKPEEEKKEDKPETEEKKLDESDLKSVTGTEMDSAINKRTPEIIKSEKEFIALQILSEMRKYPCPPVPADSELAKEISSSEEALCKLKLMDMTKKVMQMSAVEFDKITQGRIAKQTEESCLQISKYLFKAIKLAIQAEAAKITKEASDQTTSSFKDFSSKLDF